MNARVPRLWMDNHSIPKRKRGALQGYSEFLQVERFILLEIGFLPPEGMNGWEDILVGLVDDNRWRVGSFVSDKTKNLCVYITSGMLLSLLEVTTVTFARIKRYSGEGELSRFSRRSVERLFNPPRVQSVEGALEAEWGNAFLSLDEEDQSLVAEMARMSILFILHHELAHHIRRHSLLALERKGITSNHAGAWDANTERFLEIDADLHAAQFVVQRLLAGPFSLTLSGEAVKNSDWIAHLFDAVALLFILEDVRLNKGLNDEELVQTNEKTLYRNLHPLVRWGLSVYMLRKTLTESDYLKAFVTVPSLAKELVSQQLETAATTAYILGLPLSRWQLQRQPKFWDEIVTELEHWNNYIQQMPQIQSSLAGVYEGNKARRSDNQRVKEGNKTNE